MDFSKSLLYPATCVHKNRMLDWFDSFSAWIVAKPVVAGAVAAVGMFALAAIERIFGWFGGLIRLVGHLFRRQSTTVESTQPRNGTGIQIQISNQIPATTERPVEQEHTADRLTRAIEQLGADKLIRRQMKDANGNLMFDERNVPVVVEVTAPNLEARRAAIYALERIAQDSERDHVTIMEILCAYIRENAKAADAEPSPRIDIQAAATVVGRRGESGIQAEQTLCFQLDLRGTCLGGANLREARLEGADLRWARLGATDLTRARLRRANLFEAQLDWAVLTEAQLEEANLHRVRLEEASLHRAQLGRANLREAQ